MLGNRPRDEFELWKWNEAECRKVVEFDEECGRLSKHRKHLNPGRNSFFSEPQESSSAHSSPEFGRLSAPV